MSTLWNRVRAMLLGSLASLLTMSAPAAAADGPILQDPELASLQEAVRWPNAEAATIVALAGRFIAAGRDQEAFAYFQERTKSQPDRPVFLALEGLFQARIAGTVWLLKRVSWVEDAIGKLDRAAARGDGVSRFFRGLVLAELPPRFGKAEVAIGDLDWVLAHRDHFPPGLLRAVYRGLAKAHTTLSHDKEAREALARSGYAAIDDGQPLFLTDGWVTAAEGFRFRPARTLEVAPGVFVAQGYDFSDMGFVATADGLVAIDAGTTEAHARAAQASLGALASKRVARVILTHAHWDHVGGLGAYQAPGVEVIAQAGFAHEQGRVNEAGVPFRYFFGGQQQPQYHVTPDRLIAKPETLSVGGVEFRLYPAHGGETDDALMVYLPASGVLFVGDAFMPYFGAPFLAEGSPEGLLDAMALIRSLQPKVLVHGHVPLTDMFTVETLPAVESALRDLRRGVLAGLKAAQPVADIVAQRIMPESLRERPAAVLPYLVMRDNFIKRTYRQRTGYWQMDGEGVETIGARQWAAALNILAGGKEGEFARSAETLLAQGDYALALKLADLGLVTYPASPELAKLRRRALDGLRATYQQLNPFKFILYSEWAKADLPPVN